MQVKQSSRQAAVLNRAAGTEPSALRPHLPGALFPRSSPLDAWFGLVGHDPREKRGPQYVAKRNAPSNQFNRDR
jgi:hypothetical protein